MNALNATKIAHFKTVKIEVCAFNLTLSWTLCYWQELALLTISYGTHFCQKLIITATMCQTSRRKNYLGVRKKACNIHKSRLVDSKKHGKLTQCRDWGVRTRNRNIWKVRPFQYLPFGVTWDPKPSWEVTFCYICFIILPGNMKMQFIFLGEEFRLCQKK